MLRNGYKRKALMMIRSVWTNPVHFLAFGFGSGTLPKMPGTWGTVAAIPIYVAMQDWEWATYAVFLVILAIVGIGICDKTSKDLQVHDHPGIVWDEFVGFLITMFLLPNSWLWIGLGFVVFRLFDVLKPWPIAVIDRHVEGGLGIMLDDWLAGIYACLCLHLLLWGWTSFVR